MIAENKKPLNGSDWSTAKLSALLKNPIYVRADVYDYDDRHEVQMITDLSMYTGKYGAQLYGRTKHHAKDADLSDMKLVLLTHEGVVDQKATQLKRDRIAFQERMEELKSKNDEADQIVNLASSWKKADYNRKKEVVLLMIYKIMISEDGNAKIIWNI